MSRIRNRLPFLRGDRLNLSPTEAVTGAYRVVLGRQPDLDGAVTFTRQIEDGVGVGSVIAQLALGGEFEARMARLDELQATAARIEAERGTVTRMGAELVVRLVYAIVLRRAPDEAGLEHHVNALLAGTSWHHVLTAIVDSQELRDKADDPAFWDGLGLLAQAGDLVRRVNDIEQRLDRLNARQLDGEAVQRRLAAIEDALADAQAAATAPEATAPRKRS